MEKNTRYEKKAGIIIILMKKEGGTWSYDWHD
jgi:hypothetical protein